MAEWFYQFFVYKYPSVEVFTFFLIVLALCIATATAVKSYCRNEHEKDFASMLQQKLGMYGFFICIALVALIPIDVYVSYFGDRKMSSEPGEWGQVGDFFGGMLNPILAFASFIALLYTIRIQSEELRLTRQEFTKSAKAQMDSSAALKDQLEESRKQYLSGQYHELFASISLSLLDCINNRNLDGRTDKFKSYKMLLISVFNISLHSNYADNIITTKQSIAASIYWKNCNGLVLHVERDILQLLARLVTLMQEYATTFKSTAVYRNYIFQFTELVAILHFIEVLDAREGDYQMFNIDEYFESNGFCLLDINQK